MTAASFALLQSFLYLFSARIGCRGFPKIRSFPFRSEPQVTPDARRSYNASCDFPFTAAAFCANWLSGFPKSLSLSVHSEPQVPSDARRCHSACCDFSFTATAFCANLLSGSRKNAHFRFALSRKSHQTRGGVTARAVIFPLPPQRFARICCRAPEKTLISVLL